MSDDGLEERVAKLERLLARLTEDRSIGSAIGGTMSLKWKQRIQGPNGNAYVLVREAGGNLALVAAATVTDADWSDA
mgnify:CR=1 FL=1